MNQTTSHLEANEPLLPGVDAWEVDLAQSLAAQLQVNAIGGDRELEGHRLVSFCHGDDYCTGSLKERRVQDSKVSEVEDSMTIKGIPHKDW